jgi:hypothetical protein
MLQEWMGHAQYRATEVYADYRPDDAREAIYLERAFGGAPDDAERAEGGDGRAETVNDPYPRTEIAAPAETQPPMQPPN